MFKTKQQKDRRIKMKKLPMYKRIDIAKEYLAEKKSIFIHLPVNWDVKGKKDLNNIWSELCKLDSDNISGHYYLG